MKKFLCVLFTLTMLMGLVGTAFADGGVLVIYSPNSDTEVDNIIPAFEAATGRAPSRRTPTPTCPAPAP